MDGSCIHEVIDIADQVEIRALIFNDRSRFPFDPSDCCCQCPCSLSFFVEIKEALEEEVLRRRLNVVTVGP